MSATPRPNGRVIRIDGDVAAFLEQHARPFHDTPNKVLRRLLGIDERTSDEPEHAVSDAHLFPSQRSLLAVLDPVRMMTAVDVASTAKIGYSTACAALTQLEKLGLAERHVPLGRPRGNGGRHQHEWRRVQDEPQ
jgi:hypothetical protein